MATYLPKSAIIKIHEIKARGFFVFLLLNLPYHLFALHEAVEECRDDESDDHHDDGVLSKDVRAFAEVVADAEKGKRPDDGSDEDNSPYARL